MRLIRVALISALAGLVACESSTNIKFSQGIAGGGGGGGGTTHLEFTTQPSSGTAGSLVGAVQVSSVNSLGQTDTSFSGTISISLGSNPSSATLGGTTSIAASFGVATFSDLTVSAAGANYTLVASSSGFSNVTSASFSMTP